MTDYIESIYDTEQIFWNVLTSPTKIELGGVSGAATLYKTDRFTELREANKLVLEAETDPSDVAAFLKSQKLRRLVVSPALSRSSSQSVSDE
jgi:hypothetical protein